jgi:hypothetical protein
VKNYKNYLILVLGGLLAIVLLTSPSEAPKDYITKNDLDKYQTREEMKKVIGSMVIEIARLEGRINNLQNCINNLEVDSGGSGRQVYCP